MAGRRRRKTFSGPDGQPRVLVAPRLDHQLVEGVARYAHTAGWNLEVYYWRRRELAPETRREDGILCDWTDAKKVIPRARRTGAAVVQVASESAESDIGIVQPDYVAVGRLAAEHFQRRGYRHAACATFTPEGVVSRRMVRGLRAAWPGSVQILKCEAVDPAIPPDVLADLQVPTGILAVADGLADLVLRHCRRAGLDVPEQAGVLGAGNDGILCRLAEMPLSSVDADLERVGFEAAGLLDKLMHGRPVPKRPINIPPKGVVARRSTEYAGCGHPDVEAAVRFIAARFREPITSERVAEETSLSRRRLDEAMKRELNRTIAGEIEHRRVDAAAGMLIESALSGEQIALTCGFTEHRGLIRAFRRQYKCTPADYRKENRN